MHLSAHVSSQLHTNSSILKEYAKRSRNLLSWSCFTDDNNNASKDNQESIDMSVEMHVCASCIVLFMYINEKSWVKISKLLMNIKTLCVKYHEEITWK